MMLTNEESFMKVLLACVLASLLMFGTTAVWAEVGIQQEQIKFPKGKSGTQVKGKIKGRQTLDYQLRANAGQTMTVDFKGSKPTAYFNILPPGNDDPVIFIGSSSGYNFKGELPADGVYTIRVYLMGNAKDSNQTVSYTLKVNIANGQNSSNSKAIKVSDFPQGSYVEIISKGQLNLLAGPSMSESTAGQVGEGRLMQVLTCEPNDGLWCQVQAHNDANLRGWVKAQNLRAK
jgi:hypothetical protein